jgi:hypothetical protein
MKASSMLVLFLVVAGWAGASRGAEVVYARSNGDLDADDKPGRYSALNLLDDDKKTVWCSAGTGQGAQFEVVFSEKVSIDKLVITTGNQMKPNTFSAFSRVKEMQVAEGDMTHSVILEDKPKAQTLQFDPPVESHRLLFKLKAGHRGESRRHSCISDIIFYQGSRALNGKKYKNFIRKNKNKGPFIDTWVSGPEYAKNRELIFGIQGTYFFTYVPTEPMEQSLKLTGAYRLKNGNPELKNKKKWIPIKVRRDDAGVPEKIKIEEGDGVERGMPGVYSRRKNKTIY